MPINLYYLNQSTDIISLKNPKTASGLREDFLKELCEDEKWLAKRRKILRIRAGLKDHDRKKALFLAKICNHAVSIRYISMLGLSSD